MPLSNCPRCKRVFNKLSGVTMCEACRQREEEDFERVYQFLRRTPNAAIQEVAEETGVEAARIIEFYRTGRLIAGDAGYPCEKCGGPTHRGVYCDRCVATMRSALGAPAQEDPFGARAEDPADAPRRPSFNHELRIDRR